MSLFRYSLAWLGCLVVVSAAGAEAPADPLRLVPAETDFFVKIEQPRKLLEGVTTSDILKQLQKIDAVRELYESTNARRLYQLIAYFEKQLSVERMELLDRLAGGSIVVAGKFGPQPPHVLIVVQGKDESMLRRFVALALQVAEQELARQESKDRPEKGSYRNIETIRIGKDLHAAVLGSALLVSNVEKTLQLGIDLQCDGDKKSLAPRASVAEARKLVNPDPLAWMWLNLETVRKAPQAKDVFATKRNDAQLTVLFGGWLDVARRAPCLCAGLYPQQRGFVVSFRMGRGREGMPAELAAHLPPAGQPGSRPLLEPKGVLFSTSYFLDVSQFWEQRAKLFNDKQLQRLEEFDKSSGTFLAGNPFNKLLAELGAYQRIVVVHQDKPDYKTTPGQIFPAFGLVAEMREPQSLSKRIEAVLRAAAVFASLQVKLKPVEETYKERRIYGYRFPEDAPLKADVNNIRFNFNPCFVTVGNQFVASSTLALCHDLIDLLEKETKDTAAKGSPATVQTRIYADGGVQVLEAFQDRLFTQTILDQALSPEKATEQVQAFIAWVRSLGVLQIEARYGAQDFHYDLMLSTKGTKESKQSSKN